MLKMNTSVLRTIRQITEAPEDRAGSSQTSNGNALPKLPQNVRLGVVDGHIAVSTLVLPTRHMISMVEIEGNLSEDAREHSYTVAEWFLSAVAADPSLAPFYDEIELQAGLNSWDAVAAVSNKGLELMHVADPVNAKAKQAEQVLIKKFKLQPLA